MCIQEQLEWLPASHQKFCKPLDKGATSLKSTARGNEFVNLEFCTWQKKKSLKNKDGVGKDVEKLDLSRIAGDNVKW